MQTQARIEALRARLAESGLDSVVITHPTNRRYLTGYTGEDHPPNESPAHVVIAEERAVIVTSPLEAERARQQTEGFEVVDEFRPLAHGDAEVLKQLGARRVGFEDEAILFKDYQTLRGELGVDVELVPVGSLIDELRAVKAADELDLLARAIEITDQAFQQVAPQIKEGDSERDIAFRLENAMRELGADGPSFPTIVASGPNAALPHHEPGERKIVAGEPIVIDMGAALHGYCADLTRTVWVGEPNEFLRRVYPIVLRAQQAAVAGLRAGLTGREGDDLAREVIDEYRLAEYFNHSLGHGLGIRVHERPSLSPRSDDTLVPGQVVTIEPGVYIPGEGGVRIEDVAVIEEDGIRVFTRAPKYQIPD